MVSIHRGKRIRAGVIGLLVMSLLLSSVGALALPEEGTPYSLPITEETFTISYMGQDNWYSPASFNDYLPMFEEVERVTGIKIDFQCVPGDQVATTVQTRLAAAINLPDITVIPTQANIYKYAQDGLIIPLDELFEQYAPDAVAYFDENPEIRASLVCPDGKIYTVCDIAADVNNLVPEPGFIIREDWLKKLEMDEPKTIDDWYELLTAVKNTDLNENGDPNDEIPLCNVDLRYWGIFKTGFGLPNMFNERGWNGNNWWVYDGSIEYDAIKPEYKEYLAFLNKLYSEGLILSELVGKGELVDSYVSRNQCFANLSNVDNVERVDKMAKAADPNASHIMLPPPNYPDGTEAKIIKRAGIWNYYGITKDCERPDIAMKLINFLWMSEEGNMLKDYGIEGLTYEMVDGQPEYLPVISENPDLSPHDALRSYGSAPNFFVFDTAEVFEHKYAGTKTLQEAKKLEHLMIEPLPKLMFTEEEASIYQEVWPDIDTYQEEMMMKFIMGTVPLTEFDAYVDTIKSMGIDQCLAVKQAQYDRYVEALKS